MIRGAIRVLVALAAILVLLRTVDLSGALRLLASIDPLRLAPVLALFATGQIMSCIRWRLALSQIAPSPPRIGALLRLYLIGMFVNLGLPTMVGGDVARAELSRRHLGANADAYACILADRLIGLVAVVLLAFLAVLFAGSLLETAVRQLVLLAALVAAGMLALFAFAMNRLSGHAWSGRLHHFFDALLLLGRKPRFLALSLAIAVAVQSIAVVVPTALLANALSIDVPLAMHFVLVPVIVLVTQVPIAPGGLGVRETAFVLLYGGIGVQPAEAFSLGLGWSLVLITFGLLGGLLLTAGRINARQAGS